MNGIMPQPAPPFLSKEECELLKKTMLKTFPEDERESFLRICQRTHLDPFTKQIYATKRYVKVTDEFGATKKVPTLVPVTGIMGLTAVADRTGNYDGCEIYWAGPDGEWKTEWLADEPPAAAKAIVFHKHRRPEIGIARWDGYAGQTWDQQERKWVLSDFWERMPDYMLAKCAKAQALRGAFPDPLSNVFIKEELESQITDTETGAEALPSDEEKVAENQRREAEMIRQQQEQPVPGIKIVEVTGQKPTPAQALEPAFPEDRIPQKPKEAPKKAAAQAPAPAKPQEAPPPAPQASQGIQEPDNLDMSPAPAAAAPEAVQAPWKEHVILGVSHVKFHKRKVGDLNAAELGVIETQWLPAVREQWDDATDAQRADATAFEAAIAFSKMAKPW